MERTSFLLAAILAVSALSAAQQKAPPAGKTFAAILPLEAIGISAADGANISNRLRHELVQTGAFDMMERERMQDLLQEQGFQQSGACNTNACIVEVGQLIGVQKMVAGNVGLMGRTYTLNVRLIDVRTGKVDQSVVEDYTGEVDRLLTEVVKKVAGRMALAVRSPGLKAAPAKGKPMYKKWWFWTGVGAAAAGGTAAALLGGKKTTEETPPDNTLPLPPDPPQAPAWRGGR